MRKKETQLVNVVNSENQSAIHTPQKQRDGQQTVCTCRHTCAKTPFNHKPAEPQIVTEWALYLMDPEFRASRWNDEESNLIEKIWKASSWCERVSSSSTPCMVKKLCPLFCQTAVAGESKKGFRQTVPLKVHQVSILEFSRLQILKCKFDRFCLSAEPISKLLDLARLTPQGVSSAYFPASFLRPGWCHT